MTFTIIRTDKADELIHRIILYVAEQYGKETALEKLDELEASISICCGGSVSGLFEYLKWALILRH